MAKVGTAVVVFKAETNQFKKALNTVRASLKGLASTVAGQFAIGDIVSEGLRAAARAFARFVSSSISVASAFNETRNRFKVVFHNMVNDAEAAADAIASKFKLAGGTARTILGSTGDLLVGFGFTQKAALDLSTQVADLAGDLASFQDIEGGTAAVAETLTRGMLGLTRGLLPLKIAILKNSSQFRKMKQEIMKTSGVTEVQAKAIATLRISLMQSKNAKGDFIRTEKMFANQIRISGESIKKFKEAFGGWMMDIILASNVIPQFNEDLREMADNLDMVADSPEFAGFLKFITAGFMLLRMLILGLETSFDAVATTIGTAMSNIVNNIEEGVNKIKRFFGADIPELELPDANVLSDAADSIIENRAKIDKAMNDAADSFERIDNRGAMSVIKLEKQKQDAISATNKLRSGGAEKLRALFQKDSLAKSIGLSDEMKALIPNSSSPISPTTPSGLTPGSNSAQIKDNVKENAATSKEILAAVRDTNDILRINQARPLVV